MISDDPTERFRAYVESHLRIEHPTLGELYLEPDASGRVRGDFPFDPSLTIHVITAHNPGRKLSNADNATRHAKLRAQLAATPDLTVWRAAGGDPAWTHSEESFAVVGLSDAEARALGTEFEQEAVFAWRATSLDVLACVTGDSLRSGWRLRRTMGTVEPRR
ncbi:MAG TPA: DUF3293 domain-containing protein [Actinomycetes bacterium]|nr:DUF3293 domain-containing protein [Actinomycetes bacterium]